MKVSIGYCPVEEELSSTELRATRDTVGVRVGEFGLLFPELLEPENETRWEDRMDESSARKHRCTFDVFEMHDKA